MFAKVSNLVDPLNGDLLVINIYKITPALQISHF
jgi:hypothetical protein